MTLERSPIHRDPDARPDRRFALRRRFGRLSVRQKRALDGLAMIYALRMMGLYMVLPVLSIHALSLDGSTPLLAGLSIGAYGLTQAFFQIPLGHLSDRIGRKGVITLGLGIFAAGSLLAAVGQHVWLLIAGRILQGSGAVASAVVALAADLSPDHARTQAMARLGVWVGGSLVLGVATGPAIASALGVPALFLATAGLSLAAIAHLQLAVPEPVRVASSGPVPTPPPGVTAEILEHVEGIPLEESEEIHFQDLRRVWIRPDLLILCVGVFLLHATLTSLFVIMPVQLTQFVGQRTLSLILAPAIAAGLAIMALGARMADRQRRRRSAFLLGVVLFVAACAVLTAFNDEFLGLTLGLGLFIMCVSLLEPLLPALVSQQAPPASRGTAIGVFHVSQFLGSFTGGPLGGAFFTGSAPYLFLLLGIGGFVWGGMTLRRGAGFFHA